MANRRDIYYIPKNYNTSDSFLGYPYRHWIEAAIAVILFFYLINQTPFILTIRIPATVIICGLVGLLFIVGIKGESVTEFFVSYLIFRKKKRVLHLRRNGYVEKKERKQQEKSLKKEGKLEKVSFHEQEEMEDTYQFSQDWIPVEAIEYGIARLSNGDHVMILEIEPIPFFLRSIDERIDIIGMLASWLKVAPSHLQWRMTTEKTDASALIKEIEKATANETDALVLQRKEELLRSIRKLTGTQTVCKHYYLIYKYEGSEIDKRYSTDEDEIRHTMYVIRSEIQNVFSKMGNSLVIHEDETIFTAEFLYRELNPKSSSTEGLESRIRRITTDASVVAFLNGEDPEKIKEDVKSYLAPKGLAFTNSNYVIIDGMYRTWLYVRSDGYRSPVNSGWFDYFTHFGLGVTIDMYSEKRDHISNIRGAEVIQNLRLSQSNDKNRSRSSSERKIQEANNAQYVHDMMAEYEEDLFDVYIMITITASTLGELKRIKAKIRKELLIKSIRVSDCQMHPEEALRMSLPLLIIERKLFKKGKRNFLTSALAASYMYTAFEVSDKTGVPIGILAMNSTLASPDFFNTRKYSNANAIVLGSSGRGKTFFLMLLSYCMRLTGKKVFLILGDKGHEWKRMVHGMSGTYVELAPGAKTCINIMAIRPRVEMEADLVEDYELEAVSLLSKKIHQLITFIQLNMKKDMMDDEEESELSIVLTRLYERFGITADNDSIWENKNEKILKKMPVIGDLYEVCLQDDILASRIAPILNLYVNGDGKNMNGQTNVDLDNPFVAISVSNAGKRMLAPFFFIAVDCCYDEIKSDSAQKEVLLMDEVWKMMKNQNAAEYMMELYKIIRGYGGSAISATQDLSDLEDSEYGYGIINNSKIKFLFGVEKTEAMTLESIASLSDSDRKKIVGQERGQCMMAVNWDNVPITIIAPKEWRDIFSGKRGA